MNGMMQLIRQSRIAQTRPSVMVPDLIAKCVYCGNPFNVEQHEFCPYCFTDTFATWFQQVVEIEA